MERVKLWPFPALAPPSPHTSLDEPPCFPPHLLCMYHSLYPSAHPGWYLTLHLMLQLSPLVPACTIGPHSYFPRLATLEPSGWAQPSLSPSDT